ncbi:MAG: sialate O-acetylesterase, partial [Puniceicoccales bacterium]
GRELLETLKRPVGLIGTYWGGTPAQAWTSLDALAADPALADYVTQREDSLKNMDKNMERYRKVFLTKWEKDKAAWEEQKRTDPKNAPARAPRKPTSPDRNPRVPSVLFNAMVHPLLNYPIRGVIWYQAEANSHNDADAQLYATLFPAMIEDWRSRWGQGDFPFLFVQLPGFDGLHGIVEMRKSQTETLSLPNTGMAVAIDLGEKKDIHPKRKLEVGDRLARIALRDVYGQSIVASGPQPESASRDGSTVKLTMQDETGKLLIKGDSLNGFELAGEDGVYYPAQAQLEGMAVVLSSDKVSQPQSIRYAWARYPDATLFNAEELPAAPFQFEIIPAKQ